MVELGITLVSLCSIIIGWELRSKYNIKGNGSSIQISQDDITKEEDLSLSQHFNILRLINKRKNNKLDDKEE